MALNKTRLIYLGVMPFLIFAIFSLTKVSVLSFSANEFFIAYSVIILNFVVGTLWHNTSSWAKIPTSVWTNVISLLSFVLLFSEQTLALLGLAGCFIFAYFLETQMDTPEKDEHRQHYLNVRFYVTTIVVLSHFILLLPALF